jgi:hypothetical protein
MGDISRNWIVGRYRRNTFGFEGQPRLGHIARISCIFIMPFPLFIESPFVDVSESASEWRTETMIPKAPCLHQET